MHLYYTHSQSMTTKQAQTRALRRERRALASAKQRQQIQDTMAGDTTPMVPGQGTPKDPAMSKYVEDLNCKEYECNRFITMLRDKLWVLGPNDKTNVQSLQKIRNVIHTQQPRRIMIKTDAWLKEVYGRQFELHRDGDEDQCLEIGIAIAELERFTSREGDKPDDPPIHKLWKVSDVPIAKNNGNFRLSDCSDVIPYMGVMTDLHGNSGMPIRQYMTLVIQNVSKTDATEVTKSALKKIRDDPELTKDFTCVEDYNILIINTLRKTPVDYLYEKWLLDLHDKTLNVEVRAERLRKTLKEIDNRYGSIPDREPMHLQLLKIDRYQTLKYYGLQHEVDKIIKAQTGTEGTSGHLSDIPEHTFYALTEDLIRQATILQGNRMRSEQRRASRQQREVNPQSSTRNPRDDHYRGNTQGRGLDSEGGSHAGRTRNQAPTSRQQEGGTKRKWKYARACPHCGENPCEHEFKHCPQHPAKKAREHKGNANTQENQSSAVHINQLAITDGKKIEELPDQA